jgi:hypothetical protein
MITSVVAPMKPSHPVLGESSMSDLSAPVSAEAPSKPELSKLAATGHEIVDGIDADVAGEEQVDEKLATIEMAGEEGALGFKPAPHVPISQEVRFLHVSRTIHQLVTDRNRSVGIFLFVGSVLIGASSALLNAHPAADPIVPLAAIQYWCLPATFGTLAVIAVYISLLLIRARIGLIFEVTKLNVLQGLPAERVTKVNPLSVFFLMHSLVTTLGGAAAGFTAAMMTGHFLGLEAKAYWSASVPFVVGFLVGVLFVLAFQGLYILMVLRATTDLKLQEAKS